MNVIKRNPYSLNEKLHLKLVTQQYNIGFVTKPLVRIIHEGIQKNDIVWMKHPYKDRFFADPFLLKQDQEFYYVLVEEFTYWGKKGVISLLKVEKSSCNLREKRTIIEEPWHLSFPFCEENGTWVIPESIEANATYKYAIDPEKLTVIKKEKIADYGLIDGIYFQDDEKKWHALATTGNEYMSVLYGFDLSDAMSFPTWEERPLLVDAQRARSAGHLFLYEGNICRPVQDCKERYGRQVKIEQLRNVHPYETKEVATINGDACPPFNQTFHTFNVYQGVVVVDGSRDFYRPFRKALYKAKYLLSNQSNQLPT